MTFEMKHIYSREQYLMPTELLQGMCKIVSILNITVTVAFSQFNPLRPTAIQKLLEIIGRVRLYPSCSFTTALDSDINQTTGSGGHLSICEKIDVCMPQCVCCVQASPEAQATRRNWVDS